MAPLKVFAMRRMFMEAATESSADEQLRKICQHPYLSAPELENLEAPEEEQHKQLIVGSGKLAFLKVLLPKLKERGHRVLLFSQFKISLDLIEDFLYGEGYKYLRLDGDVQQAKRQKSMDAFNAPGSDYFIFLLTTRAGGVGINLATADTVIVHDPDFNPHQDQQAIARAHRYGQKKPVMVFKLMTKNSVEERIIEKTKKKLVLDHLIVQNLHRDNDEGEIDDMILHGAKALYDADAEGRAASDIHYTGKMIDDLIDKVAREAQEEMLAQVARDRAKEEGQVEDAVNEGEKPKEFMSFGFAKIWEVGKNDLVGAEDAAELDEDEDVRDQGLALEKLLQSEREREQRQLQEELAERAARTRRHKLQYHNDGIMSDDSPAGKKNKGKAKKAGKNGGAKNDSDADFAPIVDATHDSDSDATISGEEEVMQDANGHLITLPGKHGYTDAQLAEWNAAREAGKAAARGRVVAPLSLPNIANGTVPPPNGNAVAGPSTKRAMKLKETPEEKAARKAARKEEKIRLRLAAKAEARVAVANVAAAPPRSRVPSGAQGLLNDVQIAHGQHIVQWLYQSFAEVGHHPAVIQWATLGVVEYPIDHRKAIYRNLASIADDIYVRIGQPIFFAKADTVATVYHLLESGAEIVPEHLVNVPEMPFDPAPDNLAQAPPAHAEPAVQRNDMRNAAPGPASAPAPVPAMAHSARPRAPAPTLQSSAVPATNPAKDERCPYCRPPDNRHSFLACQERPSLEMLIRYQKDLRESAEDPHTIEQAMSVVQRILQLYRKFGPPESSAMAAVALAQEPPGRKISAKSPSSSAIAATGPRKRGSGSGAAGDAIVVEDDDDVPPPPKKSRIDLSSAVSTFAPSQPVAAAPPQTSRETLAAAAARPPSSPLAPKQLNASATPAKSPHRGRPKAFQGCTICGGAKFHIAAECPVVTAGPESIARSVPLQVCIHDKLSPPFLEDIHLRNGRVARVEAEEDRAIKQFHKGDAQYSVLQHLYKKAKRCGYCQKGCNLSVRECAVTQCGNDKRGRKALKDLIRQVDAEREKVFEPEARGRLDERMGQLYDAYQSWPK